MISQFMETSLIIVCITLHLFFKDAHKLMLNFEKYHFMVEQGIVLGHVVSSRGIEVDKAKVDTIQSLPYPTSVQVFIEDSSRTSPK